MDSSEFNEFTTRFYQTAPVHRLGEALDFVLAAPFLEVAHTRRMFGYFLARVAQLHPAALRTYESALTTASPVGRSFLSPMLEAIRSPASQERLSALPPIHAPGDLDFLWMEFFVTGSPQPVVAVIDVLEWRDLLRERIGTWMRRRSLLDFLFSQRRHGILARLQQIAGFSVDSKRASIPTPEDLDCLCWSDPVREAFGRALPFRMTAAEVNHLNIKHVAQWSLASNAGQHEAILAVCERELLRRSGRAALALREIVASTYFQRRDHEASARHASAYLAESPANAAMQAQWQFARSELALDSLMALSVRAAEMDATALPACRDVTARCAEKIQRVRSYRSCRTLSYDGQPGTTWRITHVLPDRYQVRQEKWLADRLVFDGWMSIGFAHYRYMGVPAEMTAWGVPDAFAEDEAVNRAVALERYSSVLKNAAPVKAITCTRQGKEYLVLECGPACAPLWAMLIRPGANATFAVVSSLFWIEIETEMLVKVHTEAIVSDAQGNHTPVRIEQAFASFNEPFVVEPVEGYNRVR